MSSLSTRAAAALCALFALTAVSCAQLRDLPKLDAKALSKIKLAQSSKIYDTENRLITTLHGEQNRTEVALGMIPPHVRKAVIAIEDERFYEHGGVDWQAVGRALVANVTSGEIREGGSTITQQYVKNVLIAPNGRAERTLQRKINEAALARQLEKRLDKDQILERYLNTVYFGQGAYGIQAAAKTFFGVPARNLSVAQAALLAGLIRAPSDYDPFSNRRRARSRRDLVIVKMRELGLISEQKADKSLREPLRLLQARDKDRYPAPYFVDYVQRLLTHDPRFDVLGDTIQERTRRLFEGGLRIHTTVDLDAQSAAESAIEDTLYEGGPSGSLVAIDPTNGHVKAMVGGRDWFATKKEDPKAKFNLAIAGEPGLGCIDDPERDKCAELRAPGTGRQAGSAFKPFTLVRALEEGVPLSKTYTARPCMTFPTADSGGPWKVCNYEESDFGSTLSLLEATVMSVNVVYAQVILDIGAADVVALAREMGIRTNISEVNSAALGTGVVNPLGMASGYGTLATNGTYNAPVAITRIDGPDGKALYEDETEPQEGVVAPQVAYLTTTALEQVLQRGTGVRAQIGRPAAGKTGTAQEYRDAWFVGYTPSLVASVWVGYPEGEIEMKAYCSVTVAIEAGVEREVCRPTQINQTGVTGGSYPAMIWNAFMTAALEGVPAQEFPVPSAELITVTIDTRGSNCLAGKFTPDEYKAQAVFAEGTEPTEECRLEDVTLEVPDVFGLPVEDARRILEDDGFRVATDKVADSSYPPGRVVGQSPAAGKRVTAGSTVTIRVSVAGGSTGSEADTARVPDVLGLRRGAAEALIRSHGFDVKTIVRRESGRFEARRRHGRVWKQSPAAGTKAPEGSTVTIWVNPD